MFTDMVHVTITSVYIITAFWFFLVFFLEIQLLLLNKIQHVCVDIIPYSLILSIECPSVIHTRFTIDSINKLI